MAIMMNSLHIHPQLDSNLAHKTHYLIPCSCPSKIQLLEVRGGILQNLATIQAMVPVAVLNHLQVQLQHMRALILHQRRVHNLLHLPMVITTVARQACHHRHHLDLFIATLLQSI